MADDQNYSRKGFFGEFFSFLRQGVSNQLEAKLSKMLQAPLRPPGALDEVSFLSTCTRCNKCVEACPVHALQRLPVEAGLALNTPYIDPMIQACELCEDFPCIQACDDAALLPVELEQVEMGRALVGNEACHTYQDKVCTLCYDACPLPEDALTIDDDFHPRVLDGCVGCGACQQRCPTYPKGIQVLSPVNYNAQKTDQELYFGLFKKEAGDP